MKHIVEIKQIIPAQDWFACFEQKPDEPYLIQPIIVWASVLMVDENSDEGDFPEVIGLVDAGGYLEEPSAISNFCEYKHKSELT